MITIKINKMSQPVKPCWLITNRWEMMIKDGCSLQYGQRASLHTCLLYMLRYVGNKKGYKVTITG